jgi:hypothetical protein
MSTHGIEDNPAPIPAFGVLGAMIGAATENLMAGTGSGINEVITGAVVGAIAAILLVAWLRSGREPR